MTTPTMALGISATGAQTVADLAAAVGALKNNLAGLAAVAGGGTVQNLDALAKEFREMRQELVTTMQGIRTDLAGNMKQAFDNAAAQAKAGADQVEAEVRKGAARIRVAAKGVALPDGASASISASGFEALPDVNKLRAKIASTPEALAASYDLAIKQLETKVAQVMKAATQPPNTMRGDGYIKFWNKVIDDHEAGQAQIRAAYEKSISKLETQVARIMEASTKPPNTMRGKGYIKWWDQVIRDMEAGEAKIKAAQEAIVARRNAGMVGQAMSAPMGPYSSISASSYGALRNLTQESLRGLPDVPKHLQEIAAKGPAASSALNKVKLDMHDAHSAARGLASGFGAMWLTWGNVVPLMAGAAISHSMAQVVKIGAEVQNTFTQIRVLAGETAESTAALNDQMLAMGRSSQFGPRELADAMKTLALAGLSAKEVYAALPEVVNLAVAGDMSIQHSADVLTTVGTAFGISASNYGYIADTIAKAAAESKSSVESIGAAFKTASVINQQYGVSLEDTAVGLSLLANASITNTAAGTALRNMYADLSGRTPKVTKALKQLGVEAIDPLTGKMKEQAVIFEQMMRNLSERTPVAQGEFIRAIFSERGERPANSIMAAMRREAEETGETTAKVYERLAERVKDAAGFTVIAAAEMSLTPLNQMKSVGASLQTTFTEVFNSVQPQVVEIALKLKEAFQSEEFRSALRSLISLVGTLTTFFVEHISVITSVIAVYFGFKSVVGILTAITAATTAWSAATAGGITAIGLASRAATVANPLLLALAAAVTLGASGWALYQMWANKGKTATDELATSSNAKALLERLESEEQRLWNINEARAKGISLMELEARAMLEKARASEPEAIAKATQKLTDFDTETEKLAAGRFGNPGQMLYGKDIVAKGLFEEARARQRLQLANDLVRAETEHNEVLRRTEESAANIAKLRKAEADAVRAQMKKDAIPLSGPLGGPILGRGNGAGGSGTNRETFIASNELTTLDAEMKKQASVLKTNYDNEVKLLDAKFKHKEILEGEYLAKSLRLTLDYEARALLAFTGGQEALTAAYEKEVARVKAAFGSADDAKELKQRLENLANTYNKLMEGASADVDKLSSGALMRQKLRVIELTGSVKALVDANDEYWMKAMAGAAKEDALAEARTKSLDMTDEQRASMEAAAKVGEQHALHIERLRKDYDIAKTSLISFSAELERNGVTGAEAAAENAALAAKIEALAKAIQNSEIAVAGLQSRAASNAALAVQQQKYEQFAKQFNQDLAGAIYDAGKDGGESLRKVLEDTLIRKPFIMVIEAMIKPATDSISSTLLSLVGSVVKGISGTGSNWASSSGFGSGSAYGNQDIGMNLDGGGYTGNRPRSGGLDGKGGFMALMHPQETVVDHYRGQSMGGATIVEINNYGGPQPTVTQSTDSRGNRRVSIAVGEMTAGEMQRPGSAMHQANRAAFGSRPVLVGR